VQIINLPYHRIAFCTVSATAIRSSYLQTLPIANRRYGIVQLVLRRAAPRWLSSASSQAGQVRVADAAIFAFVFGLLAAFIQRVFAFLGTIRMGLTSGRCQGVKAGRFSAAILAVVVHE